MVKMNSDERERNARRKEETNGMFWVERLHLLILVVFPTYLLESIFFLILITTLLTLPYFFFCPNLSSVGPCGIGGFWLFLLDRLTFFLAIEYSRLLVKGIELPFLWRLTFFLSLLIHSIYLVDHLLRSPQAAPQNDETPISTGDVSKQVEEVYEKKMMIDMEHMIHSSLETLREELGAFRDELSNNGKTMMTQVEHIICSQLGTMRDNMMHLNVDEVLEELQDEVRSKVAESIKASREDFNKGVESVADQLHESYLSIHETVKQAKITADKAHETYLVIQETVKEAKTTAEKAHKAYLIFQETAKEAKTTANKAHETYLVFQKDQNKGRVIRGEDVEGFCELREEVRRMSVEAEIAAEELSRATVELVEAGIQQWEEDNADYLASLPFLYSNHN